ncbi:MAG: polymer-forming cytoskeletal protein [Alphaproteobacteria bacterium]|nr:polymer-forming cytoskeletal protein [Alphaproteobacteria bacterium]
MTMFNRTDKPSTDAAAGTTTPPQQPTASSPAPAEVKRPQAYAQPVPSPAGTHSVSVISKALKITGQLESTEDIQIEGEVDGDVRAVSVGIGPNAKIKGTVRGDQVQLSGQVDGKIEAKKVILSRTARMSGDVIHQDITIESGAYIDGHCKPDYGKAETKSAGPKPVAAA